VSVRAPGPRHGRAGAGRAPAGLGRSGRGHALRAWCLHERGARARQRGPRHAPRLCVLLGQKLYARRALLRAARACRSRRGPSHARTHARACCAPPLPSGLGQTLTLVGLLPPQARRAAPAGGMPAIRCVPRGSCWCWARAERASREKGPRRRLWARGTDVGSRTIGTAVPGRCCVGSFLAHARRYSARRVARFTRRLAGMTRAHPWACARRSGVSLHSHILWLTRSLTRQQRRGLLHGVLLLALVTLAAAQTKSSYAGVYTTNFTAPGSAWSSFAAPNVPCGASSGAAAGCDARGVFNGNTQCVPRPLVFAVLTRARARQSGLRGNASGNALPFSCG
jgi:hypothetical protein